MNQGNGFGFGGGGGQGFGQPQGGQGFGQPQGGQGFGQPQGGMGDVFDQFDPSKANGGKLPNIRDGAYKLVVDRCHQVNGYEGLTLIVELGVEDSRNTDGQTCNPPGTFCSTAWNITKHKDMAIGNATAFVMALLGLGESTSKEQIQQVSRDVFGASNPARGLRINCTTYQTVNKGRNNPANAGKIMTLPRFECAGAQDQANGVQVLESMKAGTFAQAPAPQQQAPAPQQQAPNLLGGQQAAPQGGLAGGFNYGGGNGQ